MSMYICPLPTIFYKTIFYLCYFTVSLSHLFSFLLHALKHMNIHDDNSLLDLYLISKEESIFSPKG